MNRLPTGTGYTSTDERVAVAFARELAEVLMSCERGLSYAKVCRTALNE